MKDEMSICYSFVAAIWEGAEKSIIMFLLVVGQLEYGGCFKITTWKVALEGLLILVDIRMSPNFTFPHPPVVTLFTLVFLFHISPIPMPSTWLAFFGPF